MTRTLPSTCLPAPLTRPGTAVLTPVPDLFTTLVLIVVGAASSLLPRPARAQSVLDRTPNLSGGWVGSPGSAHFNFLHRFRLVDAGDEKKISNTPTFLLAFPLPGRTVVGAQWATNSLTESTTFNELEVFGRWAPLSAERGAPVDVAITAAFNEAVESADGEVAVGLPVGPLTVHGVGRAFSDAFGLGGGGFAGGGGLSYRLTDGISVAGDAVVSSDRTARQAVSWSGGLQLRVPLTPHTLSIQATNSRSATLQGSSVGQQNATTGEDQTFWGFEFTIPITFSRYFRSGNDARTDGGGPDVGIATGNRVVMTPDLRFTPATLRIEAGTTVVWENTASVIHTVTADPARADRSNSVALPPGADSFHSGDLRPGQTFTHTFDAPGEYVYFCVPHEGAGMVGTIVVSP